MAPSMELVQEAQAPFATLYTYPEVAADVLAIKEKKLNKLTNEIAETQKPVSAKNLINKAKVMMQRTSEEIMTENVLGFMEGTDKKEEVLVITAHYDHIGIVDGKINNGADDDGSGTVSVLELAEAFTIAKKKGFAPRRSILFMLFTGEEKGLFGSEYYSSNPIFPLKNTITDLNIDMVGRVDEAHKDNPNYVYVIGADKLSSELHNINENARKQFAPDIELNYTYNDENDPNRFYYRSDHYNFAVHNIPIIFYFNGTHPDYHAPTDDVEKINFDKMEKIDRMIFHTAWELANRDERPKVDKVGK
jgi:Zn-dependent M28 family amino/carboxypeptidase